MVPISHQACRFGMSKLPLTIDNSRVRFDVWRLFAAGPSTKLPNFLAAIAVVVVISPLAPLRAQQAFTYQLAPSTFTMALTIKDTAPGTFMRNRIGVFVTGLDGKRIPEYENTWITERVINGQSRTTTENSETITKIVTTRYGNRELIQELVKSGVLPGPPSGWSLVYDYEGEGASADEPVLTAIKGDQRVPLDDIISIVPSGESVSLSNLTDSTAYTYDRDGNVTREVFTQRGRFSFENIVTINFTTPSTSAQANALGLQAYTIYNDYPNPADRSENGVVVIAVPGAARFSNMVGSVTPSVPNPIPDVGDPIFTGTVSIGASRVDKKRAR